MPIRTTRASRLRAAAHNSDTSPSPRKSKRSSSTQSLLDDGKLKIKIIDRDKTKTTRKTNDKEKENVKKAATTYDNGAIKTKTKHSTKNILEKDKLNFKATSPRNKIDEKLSTLDATRKGTNDDKNIKDKSNIRLHVNGVELFDEIVGDNSNTNNLEEDRINDLFNDLVGQNGGELNGMKVNETGLNDSHIHQHSLVNASSEGNGDSVVPKEEENVGLLGAVCVRKVERFSELLSNLCSPCDADVLFEDILVENGINGDTDTVSLRKSILTRIFELKKSCLSILRSLLLAMQLKTTYCLAIQKRSWSYTSNRN